MHGRGDVYRIRGVYTQMSIPDPEQLAVVTLDEGSLNSDPTWNIDIVNAPDVWDQLNVTGEGAVVSNIDTGVRYTHEALNSSYRGNLGGGVYEHNYNWGSLYGNGPTACPGSPTTPCDWAGHGSHTMGTMIGGDGNGAFDMDIGMAPDAQWMACMGCDTPPNGCSDAALTGCAQWVVAPLDLDGNNPDPTMAPDVVNNSWGGGGEDDWYYSYVEAWNAANIIPVFSAGNEGPGCSTLGSPGSYDNVIGMGGTDNADNNYTSTSRGPGSGSGVFPVQKPDLAAPAEGVPSSVNTSDSAYANYSGTSMAAPHMSGLVALMRSVDPNITREEIWDIATANTVTDLTLKNGTWCGAGPDFPNYVFGYGRIDAFAVVSNVAVEMNIPWLSLDPVSGTVPIAGTMPVEVTFDATGLETGIYTGTLRILHNDPLGGEVLIPVTMHVEQAVEPAYLIYLPLLTK
jgi:subtilisin family serine protease